MQDEANAMAAVEKIGIKSLFKGELAWPMFIAIMMMLAQQLSGINVAMFFSTIIFKNAGLGDNAVYATLGMGLCNVIMTVISVYLVSFIILFFPDLSYAEKFWIYWCITGASFIY